MDYTTCIIPLKIRLDNSDFAIIPAVKVSHATKLLIIFQVSLLGSSGKNLNLN